MYVINITSNEERVNLDMRSFSPLYNSCSKVIPNNSIYIVIRQRRQMSALVLSRKYILSSHR